MHVLCFEGNCAAEHGIKQHSQTPCIRCKTFIAAVRNNLWSDISWSPTLLGDLLILFNYSADAEIANFDLAIIVKQDIVQLNISMQD